MYNALDGRCYGMAYRLEQGVTVLQALFFDTDSLLLRLQPVSQPLQTLPVYKPLDLTGQPGQTLPQPIAYENEEPNACLLDAFEYALDGEEDHPAEELLRVDNTIRARLGYRQRRESVVQPYVSDHGDRTHVLHLRRRFWSDAEVAGCTLALEELAHCSIRFNQQNVPNEAQGWYVDEAIQTVRLPKVKKGEFGVEVRGNQVRLTEKPERLYWGDYTRQGFPFYTGNMKYVVCTEAAGKILQVPYFSGAAVRVEVAKGQGIIAFLPYVYRLPAELGKSMPSR